MGYLSKVQVIQRKSGQQQFYLICPTPLAQALELQKGEAVEWIVEDRQTLTVRRREVAPTRARRPRGH